MRFSKGRRHFSHHRGTSVRPCWPARKTKLTGSSHSRRSEAGSRGKKRRTTQPALAFQSLEPRFAFAGLQAAAVPFAPEDITVVGDVSYFMATTAAEGTELWKTDGTPAGTVIVKDINAGAGNSYPYNVTAVGSTVFFTADDGVHGRELWKTDGTAAGTVLVKDINTGTELNYGSDPNGPLDTPVELPASSNPTGLVAFDSQLFFVANDGEHGSELWKSDGTTEGTILVKDINPDNADNADYFFGGNGGTSEPVVFAGKLFFSASDGYDADTGVEVIKFWSSDGTTNGTTVLTDRVIPVVYSRYPYTRDVTSSFVISGDRMFFAGRDAVNGDELWVTDGTEAGTQLLKDIAAGTDNDVDSPRPLSSDPQNFAVVGSTVFFVANDGKNGTELWKTDGTTNGTVLVKNIAEGTRQQSSLDQNENPITIAVPRDSFPESLTALGKTTLVFVADDAVNGRELWKSDGTANGTVLVKDLQTGKKANVPRSSAPNDLTPYNDAIFFAANGDELWKTDGTTAGTTKVKDIDPKLGGDEGSGSYASMAVFSGKLLFSADDGVHGSELWVSDGSTAGTVRLKEKDLPAAPVNQAPVGKSKTVTLLEDGTYTFTAADFGFSDPNNRPANTLSAVKIATLPAAGSLTNNGVAVTLGATVTAADIATGKLKFVPAANASGATYASFTFQVQDNGGTAKGGVDTDPTPRTMTLAVTPVNDAPAGTAKTVTMFEDGTYAFAAADFGFSDTSDTPANTLAAVKIATLPAAGKLTNNGVAVTVGAAVTAIDIANGKLKFAPAANASGATYASFTFRVQDNGGTANGGVNTDPTARTMTMTVTPVNDAPVGTAKTVTMLEDGTYAFTAADFGFSDSKDTPANTLSAVKIVTLPVAGSLTNDGVPMTVGAAISAADIAANRLRFAPAANASGATYASFTFRVQDNGGTANGGVDTDLTARVMTIAVTRVNDAPAGTARTVTMLEDATYTFTAANFGFSDAKDTPANTLSAVKIATLPASGKLTRSGAAVTAGASVTAADIAAGKLKFAPAADANGAAYASFTFQVQDNGGTANGGVDTDPTARVMTIDVTPVNDAPVGTSKTVAMAKNGTYTFKAADFGFSDPKDTPAHTLRAVKIVTLPAAGKLTNNGVAVKAGDAISAADIAASRLRFAPAANATGATHAKFTFKVQDNGGTANGGIDTDPVAKTITIAVS